MIPKIIHQTWKSTSLPYPFDILAASWKEMHPAWEYKLWDDEMITGFITTHYPEFLSRFNSYPKNIQRIDAFRYFLLLKEGGVYVDIDFECLSDIAPLLEEAQFVIGKEPEMHAKGFEMEKILCNAFMAALPGSQFMQFVCNRLMEQPSIPVDTPRDVLRTTGPFMLTEAYDQFLHRENVTIVEPDALYPLNMFEARQVLHDVITKEMQERIDRAFAVHYFWGSW